MNAPQKTLKQAIESGEIAKDREYLANPSLSAPQSGLIPRTGPGGLSGSYLSDKDGNPVTPAAVIRTPERQALLDARYGKCDPIPANATPIGDPIESVEVKVGEFVRPSAESMFPNTIAGIRIDDNIPIPDPLQQIQLVCEALQVGHSFRIAALVKKPQLNYIFKKIGKGNEKKFTCASDGNGWRIWRIA